MKNNTTGFKGVHLDRRYNKYAAQIRIDNKLTWLGYFSTAYEAAIAYDKSAIEHFGKFANLNFEIE